MYSKSFRQLIFTKSKIILYHICVYTSIQSCAYKKNWFVPIKIDKIIVQLVFYCHIFKNTSHKSSSVPCNSIQIHSKFGFYMFYLSIFHINRIINKVELINCKILTIRLVQNWHFVSELGKSNEIEANLFKFWKVINA